MAFAQQDSLKKQVYYEQAPNGLVRFFFDQNYYLVDKDCEFKSIERLSPFIVSKNVFHGEFKDFDLNGKLALTGSYNMGVREGVFRAYHPNGTLKWEVTFAYNVPEGDWNYYYPDGKPMLTVNFTPQSIKIISFWDQKGRKRVAEGKGTYQFKMPFDSYNEYGFPFFERKGKVSNGLPNGYWTTHVLDDKGDRVLFSEETYSRSGVLVDAYNFFEGEEYSQGMRIIPANHFTTAEKLIYKSCTFDDFSGFNSYLAEKFKYAISSRVNFPPVQETFIYKVAVDKEGTPKVIDLTQQLSDKRLNLYLERIIGDIPFYFPSLDEEGNAIDDVLEVSATLTIYLDGKLDIHNVQIARGQQR